MALKFPYTYVSCPCSDPSRRAWVSKRASREIDVDELAEQDDSTFNPHSARSAFSLFPPEHLFYCEDCRDLKCPRCVVEEIVCWYCPDCLFEAPPSAVKSDDNRCSRHCYRCPICTTQLVTASTINERGKDGPFILSCNHCMWSSLDIGMSFANPSNIRSQLDRRGVSTSTSQPLKDLKSPRHAQFVPRSSSLANEVSTTHPQPATEISTVTQDTHTTFNTLKSFYKGQLLNSDNGAVTSGLDNFSSPSSLSRIMSLYSSTGGVLSKKPKSKPSVMREALLQTEGLNIRTPDSSPPPAPEDTVTISQRIFQLPTPLGTPAAMSPSQLRPMPTSLVTKRSKRCATCKHILVKPELKVTSTRYRIKLIALSYIPSITIVPLPVTGGLLPSGPDGDPSVTLSPRKASQWIVTLKNPLFEVVNVSLGSPSVTPGRYPHKVTILCPQFSIGKSGDVWDDIAKAGDAGAGDTMVSSGAAGGEQIAGKVYDRGRNWTSIVVEVVPSSTALKIEGKEDVEGEDDEVIEIPIRVRLEWKITDEQMLRNNDASKKIGNDGEVEVDDGTRDLAYWLVLGIGTVTHS